MRLIHLNIFGWPILCLIFLVGFFVDPFAWGDLFLGLLLVQAVPFFIFANFSKKHFHNPNAPIVRRAILFAFLWLWIPSIALPFAFELGGLLISILLLLVGIWGVYGIKDQSEKLYFFNALGTIVLAINTFVVISLLSNP